MRRAPVLIVLAGLALPASALADQAPKAPPLAAKVTACSTGADATARGAVFTGSMPRAAGAETMGMRFDLYQRAAGGGDWKRLAVPNFGQWERSAANVAGFIFDKHVEQLAPAAAYRVDVRFRWYAANGKVVRHAERVSAACAQPDLRPDLRVAGIEVGPASDPGLARYVVTIRNEGRGAAHSPFTVGFSVDGQAQPTQSLPALDAGRTATVTFVAPRCTAGSAMRAEVDADRGVEEADEADNAAVEPCRAP